MSIETALALEARANLEWLADHWPDLRARLTPGGGAQVVPSHPVAGSRPPIRMDVSDLMAEIDWQVGMHRCHQLLDETDDIAAVPTTPEGRLRLVAERIGHWTLGGDDAAALALCDDARDYRRQVERKLEVPLPKRYLGPCQEPGCGGEIHAREDRFAGECPECGREWTWGTQREFLAAAMADRLMTTSEIVDGLRIAGVATPRNTVRQWIKRERLQAVYDDEDEGMRLYSFADALALAARGREVA